MNKKGFIRTLEAVVSIILIFTFIYFILPKQIAIETEIPENVQLSQKFVLEEILYNSAFRSCVFGTPVNTLLNGVNCKDINLCDIDSFIRQEIPVSYDYACEVCNQVATCIGEDIPFDKNVYANSIFLVKDPSTPKVLRIYVWEREI